MKTYRVDDMRGLVHVAHVAWDSSMKTCCGIRVSVVAAPGNWGMWDPVLLAPEMPTTCLWCVAGCQR